MFVAAMFAFLTLGLLSVVLRQRSEIRDLDAALERVGDLYESTRMENTRAHLALVQADLARGELQDAFMAQGRESVRIA